MTWGDSLLGTERGISNVFINHSAERSRAREENAEARRLEETLVSIRWHTKGRNRALAEPSSNVCRRCSCKLRGADDSLRIAESFPSGRDHVRR